MKVCTCFLLFGIFAYTHCFASNTPKSKERSVNLELETVLEFSNNDKEVDINFLNNVQNFITKVKTVIGENSNGNLRRRNFKALKAKTFTGFIQEVIRILNTYEDTAFTNFFNILDKEIRNYHYIGCKFYELTENYEIRKLIAAHLDLIKEKPTSVMKGYINALSDMLRDDIYDGNVKEIVNFINSLYRQEFEENFQKVITDLEAYGRSKSKESNNSLGKIIKNGVRSIIFDHFTNLNTNVRREVKQKIESFWKELKKTPPSRTPNVKPYLRSRNNSKNSENIRNEVKKFELISRKDLMNIGSIKANKKIEIIKKHKNDKDRTEIKQFEYETTEINQDDVKYKKKLYKHTRKDTVDELLGFQETTLSNQRTGPMDQQRIKNEHQAQPNIDSLSIESFNSLEFYHKSQYNTTQYPAIIPKKISRRHSTNERRKIKKMEALNVTTRTLTNNLFKKIWIEESTRTLPKSVLDKLGIMHRGHESRYNMMETVNKHGPKHKRKYNIYKKKWHGKIYEPNNRKQYDKKYGKKNMKKHWSKNETKYESRQTQKTKQKKHKNDNTSEPNDQILVHNKDFFRKNYVRTTDSVFNMEVYRSRKSVGPLSMKLKQNNRWSTASIKEQKFLKVLDVMMPSKFGKTIKSPRARRTATPRVKLNGIRRMRLTQQTSIPLLNNSSMRRLTGAYSKTKNLISWKPELHFRKSAEHPSSSNEGMTKLEKDPYVIERINNLERQLNEVKSRINVNTDVVTARKVTHSFEPNDDVVKRKQTETRFRSDVNNILSDYKIRQDKLKIAGTAYNKTIRIIENKYVKDEDSTINKIEDSIQKGKKFKTKFRSDENMMLSDFKNRTDKTKEAEKPDNKTDEAKDFKHKEEVVDDDNDIEKVMKQQENLKKEKKPETILTNIGDVSPKAKDKGIKLMLNDYDGDDASKETRTQNRKMRLTLSTSAKTTESTTKTTTNVQPSVAVTTPTTLRLSTISITIPVTTSHKLADVLQKAEFNATGDKIKKIMANNTAQVADVRETTLNVTKKVISELIHKIVTNLHSNVTPTTSNNPEKI